MPWGKLLVTITMDCIYNPALVLLFKGLSILVSKCVGESSKTECIPIWFWAFDVVFVTVEKPNLCQYIELKGKRKWTVHVLDVGYWSIILTEVILGIFTFKIFNIVSDDLSMSNSSSSSLRNCVWYAQNARGRHQVSGVPTMKMVSVWMVASTVINVKF
jgi:hypothetical protein